MNQRLLCFIFVARKSPSLSMTCVHEKQIIDPKFAIIEFETDIFLFTLNCFSQLQALNDFLRTY